MLREWYMHPNGQLPAYEWAFGDVNPPVHAWAAWRVYKIEKKRTRRRRSRVPRARLPQAAAQLHLVGEPQGRRAATTSSRAASSASTTSASSIARAPLPTGGYLEQSDGTSWMAMYSPEPAGDRAGAGAREPGLRGRREQVLGALPLHRPRDGPPGQGRRASTCGTRRTASSTTSCTCRTARRYPLKVRSMVGLIPLFAVETLEPEMLERLPASSGASTGSSSTGRISPTTSPACRRRGTASGGCCRSCRRERLTRVLALHARRARVPVAVRHPRAVAVSRATQPYVLPVDGHEHRVDYEPGESTHAGCSAATRTGAARSGSR